MNSQPRLSVLLTAYDNPMIFEAIQSVWSQTCQAFELIYLDDNTPLNHLGPVASGNRWKRTRYYKSDVKNDSRWSAARYAVQVNVGLKLAVGQYIGYLCDDDLWEKHKVERVLGFFDAHPDANVVVGYQRLMNSPHRRLVRNYETLVEMLPDGYGILRCDPFCVVDHSSVVHRWPIPGGEWGWPTDNIRMADACFWRQLYRAGNLFYVIPEVLDTHRYHDKSISSRLDRGEDK